MTGPRSRRNKRTKRRPATLDEVTEQDKAVMASRLHNRSELLKARLQWARAHPDRAGEVGVTLEDRTKRYDLELIDILPGHDVDELEVVNGVPYLVPRDLGCAAVELPR